MFNTFSTMSGDTAPAGLSVLMILAKATLVLMGALVVTRVMERGSAVSRHLVWFVSLGSLLLIPALWALVALRPRRGERRRSRPVEDEDEPSYWDAPDHWGPGENPHRPSPTERTDTVEAPWVREQRNSQPGLSTWDDSDG